jgi:glycine oxidase
VKGEIAIAAEFAPLRNVVFGAGGYLVPRGVDLLVGATSEDAGFDSGATESALVELRATADALLRDSSALAARLAPHRVGLRPMTPDGYPILGREPEIPGLIYACGYSRNGVLLAPLAARCVAALITGVDPGFDLSAFSVARFAG